MTAMMNEVGAFTEIFIISLYIAVVMDGFVMFSIIVRQVADAKEYAAAVLNWPKITILYAAGILMLVYAVSGGVSAYITVIEALLSVLLLADAVLSTIIKSKNSKHGKK